MKYSIGDIVYVKSDFWGFVWQVIDVNHEQKEYRLTNGIMSDWFKEDDVYKSTKTI